MIAWIRISFYCTFFFTLITGVALTYIHYFLSPISEFSILKHPFEQVYLKAHLIFSIMVTFVLGSIVATHAFPKWNYKQKGIKTGKTITIHIPFVIFSGFMLQIISDEFLQSIVLLLHILISFSFTLFVFLHILRIQKRRKFYVLGLVTAFIIGMIMTLK